MKELKFIYETTIKKQADEVVKSKTEENGTVIETSRTIKKTKPVKLCIIKPDRKLFKGAEMFYAKSLSEYLKKGLLPYSLVAKRYANDGGPLTDNERNRLKELREESLKLEGDFFSKITENDAEAQKKKNETLIKINAINAEVSNIQNAYSDIFDSTAEMKSRNDSIEWWALFLIYIDEDGNGYKPLFGEGEYEERVTRLEAIEEKEEPFYIESIKRLSYLISFWFTARNTVTKIDFETMEKLYLDTVSDYKVEEDKIEEKLTELPQADKTLNTSGTTTESKV